MAKALVSDPNWAAWKNTAKNGSDYLAVKGKCPECGCGVQVNLFANGFKQAGDKSPDFKESKPKPLNGGSPPPVKATDPNDVDMPF